MQLSVFAVVGSENCMWCCLSLQEHMAAVEAQVQGLQAALESGTASAAALQATNVALSAERAAAVSEAAAASEEVKKLTGEAARLTAELDDAREQLSSVKVCGCIGGNTVCYSGYIHRRRYCPHMHYGLPLPVPCAARVC